MFHFAVVSLCLFMCFFLFTFTLFFQTHVLFQVAPSTIHPAFEKAAHYFNLTMKHVPVNQNTFVCDIREYEQEIDSNTILLLASAPSYPQVNIIFLYIFFLFTFRFP